MGSGHICRYYPAFHRFLSLLKFPGSLVYLSLLYLLVGLVVQQAPVVRSIPGVRRCQEGLVDLGSQVAREGRHRARLSQLCQVALSVQVSQAFRLVQLVREAPVALLGVNDRPGLGDQGSREHPYDQDSLLALKVLEDNQSSILLDRALCRDWHLLLEHRPFLEHRRFL